MRNTTTEDTFCDGCDELIPAGHSSWVLNEDPNSGKVVDVVCEDCA